MRGHINEVQLYAGNRREMLDTSVANGFHQVNIGLRQKRAKSLQQRCASVLTPPPLTTRPACSSVAHGVTLAHLDGKTAYATADAATRSPGAQL
jgi:hypothetical protein